MTTDPWDNYLKRVETELPPWEARFIMSRTSQRELGVLALRTAIYLNGGGMIAVPALAEIAQLDGGIVAALVLFIAGLVLGAVAIVAGYLGQNADGDGVDRHCTWLRTKFRIDYLEKTAPDEITDEDRRILGTHLGERDALYRVSARCHIAALIVALLSLGAFIAGCVWAAAG